MRKIPYKKISALIITGAIFVTFASFSVNAISKDTAGTSGKVVIIDDNGERIEVEKSEILNTDIYENDDDQVSATDEDTEKILDDSKKAAKELNDRNNKKSKGNTVKISDANGDMTEASFDDDWALILINKEHPIPPDYDFELATIKGNIKSDVRVVEHVLAMQRAAKADGVDLMICSPYRSEEKQQKLFEKKVAQYERKGYDHDEAYDLASETVAIPGTSEHQVGIAFDFGVPENQMLDESFADTDGGKWLEKNAERFGFILRYPKGKEDITDIIFEPWHYRYVGVKAAKEINRLGVTLEEYDEMIGLVD